VGDAEEPIESAEELPQAPPPVVYKRPQSVLVVVYTLSGECLMLRRTEPPGFWQSVTGSLRPGETPRWAAEREVYEETGLRCGGRLQDLRRQVRFPILPAWRSRYAPDARFNLEHWFALPIGGRRLLRLNPLEHCEHRWVTADQAIRLASSYTNRDAIRKLFAGLNAVMTA